MCKQQTWSSKNSKNNYEKKEKEKEDFESEIK